jgi:hypothetical protein
MLKAADSYTYLNAAPQGGNGTSATDAAVAPAVAAPGSSAPETTLSCVSAIEEALMEQSATAAGSGDWQCRDYADGWITFPTRQSAEKYQQETGALMRYVHYYRPADRRNDHG